MLANLRAFTTRASRLILLSAALLLLGTAGSALASHPQPIGGAKVRATLMPALKQCQSPNAVHVIPINLQSCNPPVPESDNLTVPQDDSTVASASVTIRVVCEAPSVAAPPCTDVSGDQENIRFTILARDVRCASTASLQTQCGAANSSPGNDYVGPTLFDTVLRITDHANQVGGAGNPFDKAATLTDFSLPLAVQCTGTAVTEGGSCQLNTSIDSLIASPAGVQEGRRATHEVVRLLALHDAGDDGQLGPGFNCPPLCSGTGDEQVFLRQGVFPP